MKRLIENKYNHWRNVPLFKNSTIDEKKIERAVPVYFTINESKKVLIHDLPSTDRIIHITGNETKEKKYLQFFGYLKKEDNKCSVHINYNFQFDDWNLPLSPIYHVDLFRRVIDWRKERDKNIENLKIDSKKDRIWFSYDLYPEIDNNETLFNLFKKAKEVDDWGRGIVFDLQNQVGQAHLKISKEYSIHNFLEDKDLIKRLEKEEDSNKKGKLLEDLIVRLFSKVDGFEINERVRTETEEIDLLIVNKSKNLIWQKESTLILVECKNWTSKCGKNELVVFKEKISNRKGRAKIGFFISWNGFAETFTKELIRSSKDDIIIIPVSGKEIKEGMMELDFGLVLERWWLKASKM